MSEEFDKLKALAGIVDDNTVVVDSDEDEDEHSDSVAERIIDPETGKVTYKRKFGSGVKRPTEEKRAQCPLCKMYYKRLNTAHLTSIHEMSLEELSKTNPDYVPFFTDSNYAIENSDYAKANRILEAPPVVEATPLDPIDIIEGHVSGILDQLSVVLKFNREDYNFVETPRRVAKSYIELLKGMNDTEGQLAECFKSSSQFPSVYKGMVVETNILAHGICPHHMLPINYKVHVAYKPREKKVGISKLARCVEIICSQAKMQEDIHQEIVDAIQKYLNPEGVAVIIEGKHSCMSIRGAKQIHTNTSTALVTGCFEFNPNIRQEFYHIVSQAETVNL